MAYSEEKDLFPFVGEDQDTDIILFFTDAKNEPRKINVRRCIEADDSFTGNALGYTGDDLEDFITACPKTPSKAIHFSWSKNLEFDSNFQETNGMQFAYQNVYVDGFLSAISPISEAAFPPSIQNLGSSSLANVVVESECILEIPSQGQEIASIRILFREGNDGVFNLIDEISNKIDTGNPFFDFQEDDNGVLGYYTFRNDSVYAVVPSSQTSKNFDNLPRKAKAQSVSGNRLMYGNYLDGFDPVQVSAEGKAILNSVSQNINDISGQIAPINIFDDRIRGYTGNGYSGGQAETIGFSIDVGDGPIAPGTYRLSLDFTPEMNYHIYDGEKYFSSKNQIFNGNSDYVFNGVANTALDAAVGPHQIDTSGLAQPTADQGDPILEGYYGLATGVYTPACVYAEGGVTLSTRVGTSPANPIIIPGAPILVDIVVQVSQQIDADAFMSDIVSIIDTGVANSQYTTVVSYTNDDLVLGVAENEYFFQVNPDVSGVFAVVESRLNLNSGTEFPATASLADKISYIPYGNFGDVNEVDGGGGIKDAPAHFFIVNKADMLLNIRSVPSVGDNGISPYHGTGNNPQTSTKRYFRFEVCEVRNQELFSCLPEPVRGLGHHKEKFDEALSSDFAPYAFSIKHNETTEDVNARYNWPIIRYFYSNLTDEYTKSPNFPNGVAAKDRDGNYLTFRTRDQGGEADMGTLSSGNPSPVPRAEIGAPIAIGKWRAYSPDDMFNGVWKEGFTYTFQTNETSGEEIITITATPQTTKDWLSPMSLMWQGYMNYDEPAPDAAPLVFTKPFSEKSFSIIDGRAGVGGRTEEGVDGYSSVADGEYFISIASGDASGQEEFFDPNVDDVNTGDFKPVSNRRGSIWNTTLIGVHENFKYLRFDAQRGTPADTGAYRSPSSPTDSDLQAAALQDLGSFFDVGVEGNSISSFKTRDFHDFGVVYFDRRGRAGTVNTLPSVYVPGYSNSERDADEKGSVHVRYTINHLPPEWADSYKIVYAGSANTEDFIQYAAGGAFVEPNIIGGANDKIYVSLNYLQGNRASYASSYGASDQDTGESTLYRFTPGDKLRVISHFENDTSIVYAPKTHEFDVVGVEEISLQTGTDSPLVSEGDGFNLADDFNKYGSFVVLRNNIEATGFTASEVSSGESTHNWGNRCIFEIVTQKKSRGEELKPFYETPFGGSIIIDESGRRVHEYGTITLDQGDVKFRKVPVNMRQFNDADQFVDIVSADSSTGGGIDETSQARFRPYFLESQSVTDLYRSNANSYGKVHFAIDGYRERNNDSSITYSDATNQESYNLFYTSFNPLEVNYFDMPSKYGDIDYLADSGDSLYVAQNSKIGRLSINKSLTTTGSGSETLNLSRQVLNSPRFFLEDVGSDGHPESVTWNNSTIYFVDQSRGVVVSAGEAGMSFISSTGMDKFFKRLLRGYSSNSRITTGYNPFTEELVVSVMKDSGTNSIAPSTGGGLYSLDAQKTFAYDLSAKAWTSSYSFFSSNYATIGNRMVSFKDAFGRGGKRNVWVHDRGSKNSFYGQNYPSIFTSVSVDNANLTKDYKSISIDGTSPWSLSLKTSKETAEMPSFKDYEGTFYSEVPRSESAASTNNIKGVGQISSVEAIDSYNFKINFDTDVSQYHVTMSPSGSEKISEVLFYDSSTPGGVPQQYNGISMCPTGFEGKNSIRVYSPVAIDGPDVTTFSNYASSKTMVVKSSSRVYGDSLRDKFIELTATKYPSGEKSNELYSINIDYIESKLNSSR